MKASAIVCAVLAGTLGFSTLASAQDRNGRRDDNPRAERRDDRRDHRAERRDNRRDHRAERRDDRRHQAQRQDHAFRQGYRAGVQQPAYVYRAPTYVYQQPRVQHAPRFQRGGYLPHEYRQNRGYYVNDWRAHRGLYAPPHGHQWMQVGTEFVLIAVATGLIANLLMQ